MFVKPKSIYIASAPFIVALYALFIRFIPWLLASKPIEQIENYNLENIPPPDGAMSFAINHGRAMYYYESTPKDEPVLLAMVVSAFVLDIIVLFFLGRKLKALKNAT